MLSLTLSSFEPIRYKINKEIICQGFLIQGYGVLIVEDAKKPTNPLDLPIHDFILSLEHKGYFIHKQKTTRFSEGVQQIALPETTNLSETKQHSLLSKIGIAGYAKKDFAKLPLEQQATFFNDRANLQPKGSAQQHLEKLLEELTPHNIYCVGIKPTFINAYGTITRHEPVYH